MLNARPLALADSFPSENTWQCRTYDPISIGNGNATIDKATRLIAKGICERFDISPIANWKVPAAGNIIPIVRFGSDLSKPIPVGISICNTGEQDPIDVLVYTAERRPPGYRALDVKSVNTKECLVVDRPTALFVANRATQDRVIGGIFQTVQPGFYPTEPKIVKYTNDSLPPPPMPAPVAIEAPCMKLPAPNERQNIHATCIIPSLIKGANYRICFDKTFTPPQANGDNYPGTRAPMVLTRSQFLLPIPPTPSELIWNPIAAESCRDIYNVQEPGFVVWPWKTNPADTTWQPEKVTKIMLTAQRLP